QLSYVAIFFSRYLIGVAGRIMRIDPCSVNTFFNENSRNVTVWLGCEQRGRIFDNYWLLIDFMPGKERQKNQAPEGLIIVWTLFISRLVNAHRAS
ncbi:hypothetical protein BFX86_19600, partial [Enterobacter hormaechei]